MTGLGPVEVAWVALAVFGVVLVVLVVVGFLVGSLLDAVGGRYAAPDDIATRRRPAVRGARYPGCVTCEGAEATSLDALIRHQRADHGRVLTW